MHHIDLEWTYLIFTYEKIKGHCVQYVSDKLSSTSLKSFETVEVYF